jgi:hypothetical protein
VRVPPPPPTSRSLVFSSLGEVAPLKDAEDPAFLSTSAQRISHHRGVIPGDGMQRRCVRRRLRD